MNDIGGQWVECTLAQFAHRCLVHIADEQRKPLPDMALIATLCDAVRLVREYVRAMETK